MLHKMGPSQRSQFRRRDWGYNRPNVGSFGSTFTLFIRRPQTIWITAPGERNDPPRTFSRRWNHVFQQVPTSRCSSLTTPCSDPRCLPRNSQSLGVRSCRAVHSPTNSHRHSNLDHHRLASGCTIATSLSQLSPSCPPSIRLLFHDDIVDLVEVRMKSRSSDRRLGFCQTCSPGCS